MVTVKSIVAIVVGFLTVAVLSIATDISLEQAGVFPPLGEGLFITWMLCLALFYRSMFTIVGGYVTATLAPHSPMKHVYVLGVIGTLSGVAGIFVGWNLSQHWYPIAIAATGFILVWIGGKIKVWHS